ncbi:hypothetical protein Y032_0008g349 [Ancylostoma ceylanicum]|uniref:Uncharacterized protein n=1 Tax=Ancylostoma ceylanicum TaxID=53326 RepID=A0A016VL34_9BILA|nr:hypothetical protein Y032_0008g349 [Ancylostoma ceylanicum]
MDYTNRYYSTCVIVEYDTFAQRWISMWTSKKMKMIPKGSSLLSAQNVIKWQWRSESTAWVFFAALVHGGSAALE